MRFDPRPLRARFTISETLDLCGQSSAGYLVTRKRLTLFFIIQNVRHWAVRRFSLSRASYYFRFKSDFVGECMGEDSRKCWGFSSAAPTELSDYFVPCNERLPIPLLQTGFSPRRRDSTRVVVPAAKSFSHESSVTREYNKLSTTFRPTFVTSCPLPRGRCSDTLTTM